MPVTALYALERRIDVYAAVDVDPSSDRFRTARLASPRLASYDDSRPRGAPRCRRFRAVDSPAVFHVAAYQTGHR
ncbi:hypothetical protein FLP10_08965 [Agromyces intestinalis]|uniref:Uncharacterized protein n=1 Tax=Agromyces intestinalis TaxID=2592652 RepID=A0A5C1YER5_9MICO|nr:hypothetical protein [Agromyces intestinalis]QEO14534.1 hypothetical protein FLP10_08965 [Agromyces intestinalis]